MHVSELQQTAFDYAEEKGFHRVQATFGDRIALVHSELSEALEAFRDGAAPDVEYMGPDGKPEGVPSELADVIIRVADIAGVYNIDLQGAICRKLAYNKTRPYLHGGKKL